MTRPIYRIAMPDAHGLRYWSALWGFTSCAKVFRDEEEARDLMGKLASTGYPSVFVETGAETVETCSACEGAGEIVGGLEQGCQCGGCFPHETCAKCGGLGETVRVSLNAIEMYLDTMLEFRRRSGFVAKDSRFECLDDFFRQEGKTFKSAALTKDEATYVRRVLRGFRPVKKSCFYNAQMLVLRDGEHRLTYCEGYGLTGGLPIPIHHAWVVINDKVIDVTWDKGKVRGKFQGCYFGAPIDRDEVLENLRHGAENGAEVLPVVDNWRRGWPLVTGRKRGCLT